MIRRDYYDMERNAIVDERQLRGRCRGREQPEQILDKKRTALFSDFVLSVRQIVRGGLY